MGDLKSATCSEQGETPGSSSAGYTVQPSPVRRALERAAAPIPPCPGPHAKELTNRQRYYSRCELNIFGEESIYATPDCGKPGQCPPGCTLKRCCKKGFLTTCEHHDERCEQEFLKAQPLPRLKPKSLAWQAKPKPAAQPEAARKLCFYSLLHFWPAPCGG